MKTQKVEKDIFGNEILVDEKGNRFCYVSSKDGAIAVIFQPETEEVIIHNMSTQKRIFHMESANLMHYGQVLARIGEYVNLREEQKVQEDLFHIIILKNEFVNKHFIYYGYGKDKDEVFEGLMSRLSSGEFHYINRHMQNSFNKYVRQRGNGYDEVYTLVWGAPFEDEDEGEHAYENLVNNYREAGYTLYNFD